MRSNACMILQKIKLSWTTTIDQQYTVQFESPSMLAYPYIDLSWHPYPPLTMRSLCDSCLSSKPGMDNSTWWRKYMLACKHIYGFKWNKYSTTIYNNYNTTDEVLIFSFLSPERSLNVWILGAGKRRPNHKNLSNSICLKAAAAAN